MGRLGKLSEAILKAVGTKDLVDTETYRQAVRFLRDGILPSGQQYGAGPINLIVSLGDVDNCELVRVSQASQDDGSVRFDARFSIHPDRAGGAGVSLDDAIVEFFVAQAELDPCDSGARVQLGAALRAECDEKTDAIKQGFVRLLQEDLIWRLVGWTQREAWVQENVSIERLSFGETWVDANRGDSWVAKHWQLWVPVTLDVTARMRRK